MLAAVLRTCGELPWIGCEGAFCRNLDARAAADSRLWMQFMPG